MTPHNHTEYVDGCFRCDLSRDEAADQAADTISFTATVTFTYDVLMDTVDEAYGEAAESLERMAAVDQENFTVDPNSLTDAIFDAHEAENITVTVTAKETP